MAIACGQAGDYEPGIVEHLRAAIDEWQREYAIATCGARPQNASSLLGSLQQMLQKLVVEDDQSQQQTVYLRIPVKPVTGPLVVSLQIAPVIQRAKDMLPIIGWWWLNKADPLGAAVRLRIITKADAHDVVCLELQNRLRSVGLESKKLLYEPEIFLFGGNAGMEIAHKWFCIDSEFVAAWVRHHQTRIREVVAPGLLVALAVHTLRAARLDIFEMWDVSCRLQAQRPYRGSSRAHDSVCEKLHRFVWISPERFADLWSGDCEIILKNYLVAVQEVAHELVEAYYSGALRCGVREFLTVILLFHWNRVNLFPSLQASFARMISEELMRVVRANGARE